MEKPKKKVSDSIGKKGFRKFSDDVFPFACYYDDKTIITKNGELMQTISIVCHDNNANVNGIFSENIRNAVKIAIGDNYADYAFWTHSVKISDESIGNIINNQDSNPLHKIIYEQWEKYQKTFDNYMIVTFITVIYTGMTLKLSLGNFMTFANKSLLYRIHGVWIKRSASLLTSAVNKIMTQISQYSVRRLQITKVEDYYNSQHLEFFDRIINFSNAQFGVPIANLSSIINRSFYKTDISTLIVNNEHGTKYCTFFTIKDNNNISPFLVADIISKVKSAILVEAFHFEHISKVRETYARQFMQIKKKNIDPSIIKLSGLEYISNIDNNNEMFCRHYGGLVLVCDSMEELASEVVSFSKVCSHNGIVFGCEDIAVERAFYSIIPGNFNSIDHYNVVPFSDVFSLINSHAMDNDNIASYVNKETLCILPTMKRYPYAFGIVQNKQDILISGPKHSEIKYLFSKLLISFASSVFDKICLIDTRGSSKTFVNMSGGSFFEIDTKKNFSSPSFNPFKISNVGDITKTEILTNMISMMIMSSGGRLKPEHIDIIANHAGSATELSNILSHIDSITAGRLIKWQKNEEYGFLFDSGKDTLEGEFLSSQKSIVGFNISDTIMGNRFTRCLISYHIMMKFISLADPAQKNLMVINDPIVLTDHHAFKMDIELILDAARKKNITFIFINNDMPESLVGEKTEMPIGAFLDKCDAAFHFGGTVPSEIYAEAYQISNGEVYAINSISGSLNVALLKQNGIILPVQVDVKCLQDEIRDICQDGPVIRAKIARIIQEIGTDDPARILQTLIFGGSVKKQENFEQDKDVIEQKKKIAEFGMQILNSA